MQIELQIVILEGGPPASRTQDVEPRALSAWLRGSRGKKRNHVVGSGMKMRAWKGFWLEKDHESMDGSSRQGMSRADLILWAHNPRRKPRRVGRKVGKLRLPRGKRRREMRLAETQKNRQRQEANGKPIKETVYA